jgi:hypothetical protein
MHIDLALEQQLQRDPEKIVDVIIVCPKYSEALQAELERAGFNTTSREQVNYGLVYGRIRLADLATLRNVPEIESISADSTQYAL